VCRLELVLDETGDRLVVAPLPPDSGGQKKRKKKKKKKSA
jgi:hypothetical protein